MKFESHILRAAAVPLGIVVVLFAGCSGLRVSGVLDTDRPSTTEERIDQQFESAETRVELPLSEDWVYNSGGAFGPGAPVVLGPYLVTGNRKGEVHAVSIADGKKAGAENFGTAIDGSPAIYDDLVIVPVSWGSKKGLVAHNIRRGGTEWERRLPPVETDVTVLDDVIYFVDHLSSVHAARARDGSEIWSKQLNQKVPVMSAPVELTSSTIGIVDGAGFVAALKKQTGQIVWSTDVEEPVYANAASDGTRYFLSTTRGSLLALDNTTGEILWDVEVGNETVRVTPVSMFGDYLVVGTSAGRVAVHDRKDGSLIWDASTDEAVAAQPLATRDYIFVSTMDRRVYALDRDTGEFQWETELKGRAKSAMAALDNQIFVLSEPRLIYRFISEPGGIAHAE